ncbi:MAG: serine hydrolase domain-containing protein [Kofleriaceae bacterium]
MVWLRATLLVLATLASACSGTAAPPTIPSAPDRDPDGPHAAAVAAQVKPFIDAEVVSGIVVGLYDGGKREIYGFGTGPKGAPPNGTTLFEIGSITKVFTALLLADSVQRREVSLDTAVSDLLPPGVTVPSKDKQLITLQQLALHTSSLPRLPPSLPTTATDPYAAYTEEMLYRDLIQTQLEHPPGTMISYSNFGYGLLGFALGRKIGGGYAKVMSERILRPLGLGDTYVAAPPGTPNRIQGTNDDLASMPFWNWDVLAGAGTMVSNVRDQLTLIDAELDAAAGGKSVLRAPMRLTQESQLDAASGPNVGLGWQIDREGRYWHNGGTGGFHSFISFDPKTKRGVVVLASTSTSLVDRIGGLLFKVLANEAVEPAKFPTPDKLAPLAGSYDFSGTKLVVTVDGKRLYIEGPGEPRHRLMPLTETEFLIEAINAAVIFQKEGDKVERLVFAIGDQTMSAARVDEPTGTPPPPSAPPAP